MNKIKVIKTKKDYEDALELVEVLMGNDPDPDSEDGEKLALLSVLIEDYESKNFSSNIPNPIDAIKFRMEQKDLKPADLIPYIGSRSRVSEVLSGKRRLTSEMMRALESGLDIPAKVLLKKPDPSNDSEYIGWDNRLLKEMEKRGYLEKSSAQDLSKSELIKNFFAPIGSPTALVGMLRKSHYRSSPFTDKHALAVWSGQVIKKAKEVRIKVKYKHGCINNNFLKEVVGLSAEDNGPLLAREYLKKCGIVLVVEPHFSKTHLDGATILTNKDHPIIGLTLRHDRLDNFWYTLMHELAHVALHYNHGINLFYDELENIEVSDIDKKEKEADRFAGEVLVPEGKWEVSPAKLIPSVMAAKSLAKELGVHIAIVAGKMRHEGGNYMYLNKIIKQSKVRHYFPEVNWSK